MKVHAFLKVTIVLFAFSVVAQGQVYKEGYAIGGRFLSSLGFGVELTKSITPIVNIRLGMNSLPVSYEGTQTTDKGEEFDVKIDIHLQSSQYLIDWHPKEGSFRLSAGGVINNNSLRTWMQPQEGATMGDREFEPWEIGTISSKLYYENFAPYFGLGFGNAVDPDKRAGFVFDLGVMYTNSPSVDMTATRMLTPTAEQSGFLEEKYDGFYVWFVVSMGITFRIM